MSVVKGLEWTFDTVAEEYDRWTPEYVPELYTDIFRYININDKSNVLEVGMGTGQATRPILETGCTLTAVEPGKNLAAVASRKFAAYKGFSVAVMPFQKFSAPDNSYDLIYSAGAFHWVPEEYGYSTVASLLKPGGAFARFARHPMIIPELKAMHDDMQKVYAKYMNYSSESPVYSMENAKNRAELAVKYGLGDISYKLYYRDRSYTSDEYVKLISVYSDHIVLPVESREGFYGGIKAAIDANGGVITLRDTIDLALARK